LLDLFGAVEYEDDYDPKAQRAATRATAISTTPV